MYSSNGFPSWHVYTFAEAYFKKPCMQEGPQVEKCPLAIRFLGTYVIVMGVTLLQSIEDVAALSAQTLDFMHADVTQFLRSSHTT